MRCSLLACREDKDLAHRARGASALVLAFSPECSMPHTALNGGAKRAIIQVVTACAKVAGPAPYWGLCEFAVAGTLPPQGLYFNSLLASSGGRHVSVLPSHPLQRWRYELRRFRPRLPGCGDCLESSGAG